MVARHWRPDMEWLAQCANMAATPISPANATVRSGHLRQAHGDFRSGWMPSTMTLGIRSRRLVSCMRDVILRFVPHRCRPWPGCPRGTGHACWPCMPHLPLQPSPRGQLRSRKAARLDSLASGQAPRAAALVQGREGADVVGAAQRPGRIGPSQDSFEGIAHSRRAHLRMCW